MTDDGQQELFDEKELTSMKTGTKNEALPVTAAEIARRRLDAYLDAKLRDEYDFDAWELYTFLLEKAMGWEVDRSGYLSEAYMKDRYEAAKNTHKKD
jgi:hypothetical protein